jgi:hypothetical protein
LRFLLLLLFPLPLLGQPGTDGGISASAARQHLEWLSSDLLGGRGNGTQDQLKATLYIAEQFKASGLEPMPGKASYFLPFSLLDKNKLPDAVRVNWNGKKVSGKQVIWNGSGPFPTPEALQANLTIIHHDSAFTNQTFSRPWPGTGTLLLWTTINQGKRRKYFPDEFKMPAGGIKRDIILLFVEEPFESCELALNPDYIRETGWNVAGWKPGSDPAAKMLMLGAHYDHMGREGAHIMNGANDNASGTTALLMLARHFGNSPAHKPPLLFVAFSGEELGLYGSNQLASEMEARGISAMLNLEMLGVPQHGAATVFFTGSNYSPFPEMLSKGLEEKGIRIIPEPSNTVLLFERSDNLPFAKKGVPAHTIMASDENDLCYHKPCDDADRINFDNLTLLTEAIAHALESLLQAPDSLSKLRSRF